MQVSLYSLHVKLRPIHCKLFVEFAYVEYIAQMPFASTWELTDNYPPPTLTSLIGLSVD